MKIKQTILVLAALIGIGGFLISPTVSATDCGGVTLKDGQSCCGGVVTSILSCDGTKDASEVQDTGLWNLLVVVINIMTAGIGVAAMIGLAYSAVLYTSAGANSEKLSKARNILRDTAIGIVTYAVMYAGLNYIIPGGLFG